MKKLIALLLVLVMVFALSACGSKGTTTAPAQQTQASTGSDLKIGVILLHDETIGYDFAHLQGIQTACKNLGINEATQVVWKYNIPEDQACYEAAVDLIEQGCTVIISDSYGHQSYMTQAAEENPNITFLIATGDTAAVDNCQNTHNFFTHTYESRHETEGACGRRQADRRQL